MSGTSNQEVSQAPKGNTYADDKGLEHAMGVGRNGKRLNTHCADLQELMEQARDEFLEMRSAHMSGSRHDFPREGLLGEIIMRTPIFVYDLPELVDFCDTAFVDRSGKMYISHNFARRLLTEHAEGKDTLFFIFRHEASHLQRLHLQRLLDFPTEIAMAATDIRINIDIAICEVGTRHYDKTGHDISEAQLNEGLKVYLEEIRKSALGFGWALTLEDHAKYKGMSEEAIATELYKSWKEKPPLKNRDVSFAHIMEGAACEVDAVKVMLQQGVALPTTAANFVSTPAELSALATELRRIGAEKAKPSTVSDQELQDAHDKLDRFRNHQGLLELQTRHDAAATLLVGTAQTHKSGNSGDAYLDILTPNERVEMARDVLKMLLEPNKRASAGNSGQGSLSIQDLERFRQPQRPQDGKADRDTIPNPTVQHTHNHIIEPAELAAILKDAGLAEASLEALGYHDLEKLDDENALVKDNIISAINKATEDMMRVGSRYPGGHLLNYAKQQMLDFYKPVMTWQMKFRKMLAEAGRGSRFDELEPWAIYHVDAADMGYANQNDVPYMGSMVTGKLKRPLGIAVYDTSGSVDDSMLKRNYSEGLNMSSASRGNNAPEVIHAAADTVMRGKPILITPENLKTTLKKGIETYGRGGTNLLSMIECSMELVSPGSKSGFAGRDLDFITLFTDTGDTPPSFARLLATSRKLGLKKLPTILIVAAKECYDEAFAKEVSKYGHIVYYDTKAKSKENHVDFDKIGREQDQKQKSLQPAERKAPKVPR